MAGKFVEKPLENATFGRCMRICVKEQKSDARKIQYMCYGSQRTNRECNMPKPGDSIVLIDGSQNMVENVEVWATGNTIIEELYEV